MTRHRLLSWLIGICLVAGILTAAPTDASASTTHAQRAATAVAAARSALGRPYKYGGNGPYEFDCSGLTKWSWAKAGVTLPRTSRAQFAGEPRVWWVNRQPGDLIAYGNPVRHITIYIGSGKMIAAPHTGTVVQIQTVYWTGWRGMVRPP
jgi:cell wall-associated NlpC family hydrolase